MTPRKALVGIMIVVSLAVQLAPAMPSDGVAEQSRRAFNVRSFGAKGNGSTDDTRAINLALAAAKAAHGVLYFPPGTYDYSSPLNLTGIANLTIMGAGPTEAIAGVAGANSTMLRYTGPPLPSECPVELTNSDYMIIKDISFASSAHVACEVLLGSARAESFHIEFDDVAISRGSVASVADFGCENVVFHGALGNIVYGPDIGFLVSSNGGEGYGVESAFGYTFTAPWSTSGYSFSDMVFTGNAPGHAVEVDGTGRGGTDVAFMTFRGAFFQLNAAGPGAAAFYVKGEVDDVTFVSPRVEIDVGPDPAAFIQGAPGSNLTSINALGLNTVDGGGGLIYGLRSFAPAQVNGMSISGDAPAISWVGNISGLHLRSYSSLGVKVLGNLRQSALDSFTGHGSDAISVSGQMDVDINGLKNVVWYVPVFSGSSTFRLPWGGFSAGIYKATYNSAGCEFFYSKGVQPNGKTDAEVRTIGGAVGSVSAQLLSCPPAGRYGAAPSVAAAYRGTGGVFVVQRY